MTVRIVGMTLTILPIGLKDDEIWAWADQYSVGLIVGYRPQTRSPQMSFQIIRDTVQDLLTPMQSSKVSRPT